MNINYTSLCTAKLKYAEISEFLQNNEIASFITRMMNMSISRLTLERYFMKSSKNLYFYSNLKLEKIAPEKRDHKDIKHNKNSENDSPLFLRLKQPLRDRFNFLELDRMDYRMNK